MEEKGGMEWIMMDVSSVGDLGQKISKRGWDVDGDGFVSTFIFCVWDPRADSMMRPL